MPLIPQQQMPYYTVSQNSTSKTIILTNDQIKALPTTSIELIPAPGAGKAIIITTALCIANTTAGAYTLSADASWSIIAQGPVYLTNPMLVQTLLNTATIKYAQWLIPSAFPGTTSFDGYLITGYNAETNDIENKPIHIADDIQGVVDYTGGNAANTLTIKLTYQTITL